MPTLSTKRTMARASQPMAKRLKRMETQIAQNKGELKFREGTSSVFGTGSIRDVTSFVPQGISRDQRVGAQIRVKKVECRILGNGGAQRYRAILYTSKDPINAQVPIELGDNFPSYVDTDQYNVWDEHANYGAMLALNATSTLDGEMPVVKKTFSIPMKTLWRKGQAEPYHNPVNLQLFVQGSNALAALPPADYAEFQYKIWYYDA